MEETKEWNIIDWLFIPRRDFFQVFLKDKCEGEREGEKKQTLIFLP